MKKKIILLGAGIVGKAMAMDLSKKYEVTAIDISEKALSPLKAHDINTLKADLSRGETIQDLVAGHDLVVGAVPGFMGYHTVKNVIQAGKDIVDISFFPQDPFELDDIARERGVTAVVDCGVAPGMSNIILGYHNHHMKVENYLCLVGGLPFKREWPWEYKAVFSPIDVIEEYIRPARYVLNKQLVVKEALSDPELVEFDEVGTLEAWNSDGLRSLVTTMEIPNMIEKTLRYPGTIEYIRVLRESGFFSDKEINLGGKQVRPLELTARLLFNKWKMEEGDEDYTVMRVEIDGKENNKPAKYVYQLYDQYDRGSKTLSMARTTGYTCTAAVDLMMEKGFKRVGICPPEHLGEEESNFRFILKYLEKRNVFYRVDKS